MKRASLIALLLILGVVIAAYLLKEMPKAEDATFAMPSRQLSLDPSRVMRVDITRTHSFVRLEKVRGEWRVTEPVYAAIDPDKFKELQLAMSEFKLNGMVSTNPEKQSLFQVDDNGTSVLFVNDDGSTVSLIVGKAAPTPGTAFVRTPLSDTVFIAQGLTPVRLNNDLREWRRRGVFESSPDSIMAFSISGGGRKFDLVRANGGWTSRGQTIPANIIGPALTSLSNIQAEAFIDTAVIIRTRAKYQVDITGANNVHLEFYPSRGADTNFILKTSGSSTLAVVRPSITRELQRVTEYLTPVETPVVVAEVPPPAVTPQPAPVRQEPPVSPRVRSPRRSERRVAEPAQRAVIDEGNLTVHTVKRGETIEAIARKYEVTIEQLRKWNGLQNDNVVQGMEMYVFIKKK